MHNGLKEKFFRALSELKSEEKTREQAIQAFLEKHTELIPVTQLLNNGLHFNTIISGFSLKPDMAADYIYLTEGKNNWRIILVKVDTPEKKIFKMTNEQLNTTLDFNTTLSQVANWRSYINEKRADILSQLQPLLKPGIIKTKHPEFRYQIIFGRSEELDAANKRDYITSLKEALDVSVVNYDNLISLVQNTARMAKNVMYYRDGRYGYHSLNVITGQILPYVSPKKLYLTQEQKAMFTHRGYDMNKWENTF
ncbi:Shedu anti-phage system protein SduA domain-containing protein [Enterobacteriaceae bacterium LUAb1]